MADKRPMPEPIIVDVQGVGPVEFPAGTTGAQIESWVLNHLKAQRPAQTWGEWGGNMAARVGGGIAGGVIGSLAGPVGTFAGTATGAAMGDEWAQSREVAQGVRAAVNPLEMVAAGVTAPIPGATLKRGAPLLRQVPRALAAGVPGAAASSVGMQMAQTGTVDPWRTAMETGRGAVLGGVTGLGVEGGLRGAQSKAVQKLVRDETGAVGRKATLEPLRAALGAQADDVILAYEDDIAPVSDNWRSNSGRSKADINVNKFLAWLDSPRADAIADDAEWKTLLTQARAASADPALMRKLAQGFEVVPDWSTIRNTDGPDDYLYHVTLAPAAQRILKSGSLVPQAKGLMGRGGGYGGHSQGRVFLTDRDGVGFWTERAEAHAIDMFDDPPEVAVIRIPKASVPNAAIDDVGTKDARATAYYVQGHVGKKATK